MNETKTPLTKQEREQLFSALWKVADTLRGAMTADNFRDYMLGLLFFRYLSSRYEEEVRRELGSDLPADKSLAQWYEENQADVAEFEEMMRGSIHYIIKPEYLWSSVCELARTQSQDTLETLEKSFKYIEEESFKSTFKGLFAEINLHSEKLGKDYASQNKMICNVIKTLNDNLIQFDDKSDILGDAYEYLIGQFAAGSGKKAGEFYTPQQVSTILSNIVWMDCQNPATGYKKELTRVLDFACGSGSLLLNIANLKVEKEGQMVPAGRIGKIYGQEKEITTFNLARMNMLLHGQTDSQFEIFHGDTLTNDWDILRDSNPSKPITFDAVVANPPFSLKWDPDDDSSNDSRFKNFGVAPKSAADFAFLLHGFHYLDGSGTMAIVLPHGVLFRGGSEERIRRKLIENDNIDAIIGLPSNLFFSTSIPVCIIVLKKCRRESDVLFINAANLSQKVKKQNVLSDDDIKAIVDAYRFRKEDAQFSRNVSLKEIKDNDYNLNITRYVSLAQEEAPVDLDEVNARMADINIRLAEAKEKHTSFLRELGLKEI